MGQRVAFQRLRGSVAAPVAGDLTGQIEGLGKAASPKEHSKGVGELAGMDALLVEP